MYLYVCGVEGMIAYYVHKYLPYQVITFTICKLQIHIY